MLEFNPYQSSIEVLNLEKHPQEVQDNFFEALNTVPFIRALIDKDRPRAKDLPRDEQGKIIVDLTKPHILENMDYFRPAALQFQKTGRYTDLRPNINPNSEFGKWIREEVRRCYEGYVRESDGEWIPGDYYFFLNYCPMSLAIKENENQKKAKRVLDFPRVWEGHYLKFHYLHQAREHGMHAGELAARSKGKAHPYSQIVYTPEGKKLWGDIKIGDYLYGEDGVPTKVIDIPYDEYSDIYKVTLSDNRVLYCTLGHLFKVKDSRKKGKNKYTIKSLEEIINGRYKILRKNGSTECYVSIYKSEAVEFKYSDILIDPYTLGLLLGDGCFRTNYKNVVMFSSSAEDINTYKKHCPYEISKVKGKYSYRVWIKNISAILERYNLNHKDSSNKHIPEEYLYNSKEVRLNLLKGLMDSDGTVNNNGIPMFTTTSLELCENIIWLCRSLGYNTRMFKKPGKYNNKVCKLTYNISILTNDPIFNLQRKLDKLTSFPTAYSRSRRDWTHITSIEYSHKEQAKCVTVDNDSHCYLIGDFIPTHNSFSVAALLAKRFVLGESKEVNKKVTSYITAAEKKFLVAGDQTLDKFQFNIDWNAQHTEFPSRRLTSSINNMQWRMGYKDIDTGTERGTLNSVIGVTSKDDESKLRGSRGVLYVLEEWGTFPKLLDLYNNLRPSVEDGEDVFGMIVGIGCVCKGTKVLKANGTLANIEDVQLKDKLLGYNGTESTVENISWKQPETYKQCVRIVTEKNNYLDCSIDHPILALNKNIIDGNHNTCSFYLANELKVGDTLLMPRKIGNFGVLNVKDAFLLGALFGDGNYTGNSTPSLSITTNEEYEYYNTHYDIGISKLKDSYAQIYFRGLKPLLKEYKMFGQSFERKQLPYNINEWDKESVCNFLAGYFNADGNVQIVKKKHRSIKLTCKYENILIQIKYLLHKLGISSHVYKEAKKSRILHSNVNNRDYVMPESECYVLYISNSLDVCIFRDNIKFLIKSKQERLDSYIPQKSRGQLSFSRFKMRNNNKGKNFIGKTFKNLQMVTIKKIEDLGIQRVYNMTADTTHTYISNGFISSNTAGDKDSDFAAAQEIMSNPRGYNMYPIPNVFDKEGQGKREFVFFFPGYVNRAGCYDADGNSDVTKALLQIYIDRYTVKYNSTDINSITKRIAEIPITPQEAMQKVKGNMFPITELTNRLNQLDANPSEMDDVYTGTLVFNSSNKVEFMPTTELPIREFPLSDNKAAGTVEIFKMPETDSSGHIPTDRYIASLDPVDADQADTLSLCSIFVLDLWTDKIVCEYTGRQPFADDNFELLRKICLFYNAKCLYENNLKGTFSYFSKMNSLYLLADTPTYLKDRDLIKSTGIGNTAKGVNASLPINNYANRLIRDWLLKPVTFLQKSPEGNEEEVTIPNLFNIRNRALLKELILYHPETNCDRIRSLGMLMLYREEKMILYEGDFSGMKERPKGLESDDFFNRNKPRNKRKRDVNVTDIL